MATFSQPADSQGAANHGREHSFWLNNNILMQFPQGTQIITASRSGTSEWSTRTFKLGFRLPDGSKAHYFLKRAFGKGGKPLLQGDYTAMSEMYSWAPQLVPSPHSWGICAAETPTTHFFLSQFINLSQQMPALISSARN